MIVARIEGLRAEMAWSREDLAPKTNTCSYIQEMIEMGEYEVALKEKNLENEEIEGVRRYRVEYGSLGRSFPRI